MESHDPEQFVHLLREHLAVHDKRLVFLFGAGTSSAVNIAPVTTDGTRRGYEPLVPAVALMTTLCHDAVDRLSPTHARAWRELEMECAGVGLQPQIESVLGRLRLKIEAAAPPGGALGLDQEQLTSFEQTVRTTIAQLASPAETDIPPVLPHDEFALWVRHARRRYPIEIFTTNYDILIERSLEHAKVPLFDGFVGSYQPYFSPDALESDEAMPGRDWTRVWKLHGSTNWQLTDQGTVRLATTGAGDMILPSHRKYDESRKMPYLALMDRLARCLSADGALLVTCGYSWGDEHVNDTILTALDNHPRNAVIALLYPELDEVPHLSGLAQRRNNLWVIGRRQGILRGQRRDWALPHEITAATASFLDICFDSDAQPQTGAGPVPGRMQLGDFITFCAFLARMSTRDEA